MSRTNTGKISISEAITDDDNNRDDWTAQLLQATSSALRCCSTLHSSEMWRRVGWVVPEVSSWIAWPWRWQGHGSFETSALTVDMAFHPTCDSKLHTWRRESQKTIFTNRQAVSAELCHAVNCTGRIKRGTEDDYKLWTVQNVQAVTWRNWKTGVNVGNSDNIVSWCIVPAPELGTRTLWWRLLANSVFCCITGARTTH
jgi:hypothetical protein